MVSKQVNSREAGDLRCHRAHYDVAVMGGKKAAKGLSEYEYCSWYMYLLCWCKIMLKCDIFKELMAITQHKGH